MGRIVSGGVPQILRTAHQYLLARDQAAACATAMKPWHKDLKTYIDAHGEETPEGHLEWLFPDPLTIGGETYRGLRKQKKQGTPLLDEERAEELITELGLRDEVIKTVEVEVPDWDQLYILNQQGRISDDQLDGLFDTPEPTWALTVIK